MCKIVIIVLMVLMMFIGISFVSFVSTVVDNREVQISQYKGAMIMF